MKNYCASSLALGWAVSILLGQCALLVTAESGSPALESNDALETTERLDQLKRQSYLRKPEKVQDENLGLASERIMKDLTEIFKSESYKRGIIRVGLVDDNLYEWEVQLSIADKDSKLHHDLVKLWGDGDHVVLRLVFNDNYPNEPPFVRIAYPYLVGRHIERGGSLCMEMLTKNGWNNKCTLESLFLSISLLLIEVKARVNYARSEPDYLKRAYNEDAARRSYDDWVKNMQRRGNWQEI